jgi:hypothetical protein
MSTAEAAAFLGVAVPTMKDWRQRDRGPSFIKLGYRTYWYAKADLEVYAASRNQREFAPLAAWEDLHER